VTPFQILGIPHGADLDTAKAAYRRLAKKYHPDVNPNGADEFRKIQGAYEAIEKGTWRQSASQNTGQRTADTYTAYADDILKQFFGMRDIRIDLSEHTLKEMLKGRTFEAKVNIYGITTTVILSMRG
jgi:DnaJ-class molecular chaperone